MVFQVEGNIVWVPWVWLDIKSILFKWLEGVKGTFEREWIWLRLKCEGKRIHWRLKWCYWNALNYKGTLTKQGVYLNVTWVFEGFFEVLNVFGAWNDMVWDILVLNRLLEGHASHLSSRGAYLSILRDLNVGKHIWGIWRGVVLPHKGAVTTRKMLE